MSFPLVRNHDDQDDQSVASDDETAIKLPVQLPIRSAKTEMQYPLVALPKGRTAWIAMMVMALPPLLSELNQAVSTFGSDRHGGPGQWSLERVHLERFLSRAMCGSRTTFSTCQ